MNTEDVENMTVVSLKRELKSRNLPMVGNKAELAQRLMEHLANEESSMLQTSGISDDFLDVPEDVVLGIAAPEFTEKKKENNEITLTTTNHITKPICGGDLHLSSAPKPATSQVPQLSQQVAAASPLSIPSNAIVETKPVDAATIGTIGENVLISEKRKLTTTSSLSENERKLLRAKKFNIPVTQTKEMRAERFGLKNSTDSKSTAKTSTIDENIAKKRAERFGIPLHKEKVATNLSKQSQDESSKLIERARRFGLDESRKDSAATDKNKIDDQILKRKQRFGGGGETATKDSNASAAKKMLRAQRFGLKF